MESCTPRITDLGVYRLTRSMAPVAPTRSRHAPMSTVEAWIWLGLMAVAMA